MDSEFQGKQNFIQSVFNHQAIGFDVDHCLIRYKIKALTKLCYKVICQTIIDKHNYSSSILDLTEAEYGFALNYLVIHIDKGIVLRIAENKEIIKCYRGFTELDVETEYGPTRMLSDDFDPISSIKQHPQYIVCATYFENVIPLIFAKLTQYKCEKLNTIQLDQSEYHAIFGQIIEGLKMNYQHFDQHQVFPINQYGRFFRQISENPQLYMFKQNQFRTTLENLKSQGKVLFIVTNSHVEFMNLTMTYSYGEVNSKSYSINEMDQKLFKDNLFFKLRLLLLLLLHNAAIFIYQICQNQLSQIADQNFNQSSKQANKQKKK